MILLIHFSLDTYTEYLSLLKRWQLRSNQPHGEMKMQSYYVPLGRMAEYQHEEPERTGVVAPKHIFDNVKCVIFPTRQFLLNAVKKGGIKPLVRHTITLPGGCTIDN